MLGRLLRLGDRALADVLEAGIVARHRRRVGKLGHAESIRPRGNSVWAAVEPPPRAGNDLEVLIDGETVLPAIAQAIRAARRHVHLAGWAITPQGALSRRENVVIVRDLLAEVALAVEVRVLLWAGAPLPVIRPDRRCAMRSRVSDGRVSREGGSRPQRASRSLPSREDRRGR